MAATAQDSALVIASLFPVHVSVPIILPFITGNDPLTRLLAFRIQLSIVETVTDVQQMRDLLPVIIPGILKVRDDWFPMILNLFFLILGQVLTYTCLHHFTF